MLILTQSLSEILNSWLADRANRGRFPLSHKSHYIFVNESGRELSLRAARDVFLRLRTVFDELDNLSSHVLRHDMNDRLVEQAGEDGTSVEELMEDMIYLNGYSDESLTPLNYTKRSRRLRANKRILEAVMDLRGGVIHPAVDEHLPQAVSV